VIYGNGQLSSLAWFCITEDSPYEVSGFTVDKQCISSRTFHDLPLVPFEGVELSFPPDDFKMLIPIGYHDGNRLRAARYHAAKQRGYEFISYVSSRASRWSNVRIGENSMIYEGAIIQPFSQIGDNVIVRSGTHVSHHCHIQAHSYLAPRVCLGGCVTVGKYCVLGLNATIRDNVMLAEGCFVGAGAVILKDTTTESMYAGVPARRVGAVKHSTNSTAAKPQ
jgi:sugar O-acyltransferase (sialic acid O-acetyltransferase NeuD family)